jgi:hypothetical protein
MRKTTVYLPDELYESLRRTAQRMRKAQAPIVREALGLYLRTGQRPMPRSIGTGEDDGLAGRDAKAWLRTI